MWRILQQPEPEDYVLATGEMHAVREFIELAFQEVGIAIAWQGSGLEEIGIDAATGRCLVEVDARYFRPTEVDHLVGDPAKARRKLGWSHKTGFKELVREMVRSDLEKAKTEASRGGKRE
jgi:GDPmannose 4,6-dehydratase